MLNFSMLILRDLWVFDIWLIGSDLVISDEDFFFK